MLLANFVWLGGMVAPYFPSFGNPQTWFLTAIFIAITAVYRKVG